ncbi:hypothetical protein GGR53DRAFT_113274 [Hypoxylon sp. FL1150]|nr:hypothetical protein GGR53DRAFT_113274 [Hypoxylon sp. FL1150]
MRKKVTEVIKSPLLSRIREVYIEGLPSVSCLPSQWFNSGCKHLFLFLFAIAIAGSRQLFFESLPSNNPLPIKLRVTGSEYGTATIKRLGHDNLHTDIDQRLWSISAVKHEKPPVVEDKIDACDTAIVCMWKLLQLQGSLPDTRESIDRPDRPDRPLAGILSAYDLVIRWDQWHKSRNNPRKAYVSQRGENSRKRNSQTRRRRSSPSSHWHIIGTSLAHSTLAQLINFPVPSDCTRYEARNSVSMSMSDFPPFVLALLFPTELSTTQTA